MTLRRRMLYVVIALCTRFPPLHAADTPASAKLDADLEKIEFTGALGVVTENPIYPSGVIAQCSAVGTFTLRGAKGDSLRPLPLYLQGCPAIDADSGNVYIPLGWCNRVSLKTGLSARLIDESEGRVPLTQLTSLAFDSRRRQMLVLDNQGWQYRYDVDTKRWIERTRAWEPQGRPVPIYEPGDDTVFMLAKKTLSKFSADGDFLSSVGLPQEIPLPDAEGSVFAAAVQGSIVVITPVQKRIRTTGDVTEPMVYVLDPVSGKRRYSGPTPVRDAAGKPVGFVHRQWSPQAGKLAGRIDDLSHQIAARAAAGERDLATQLGKRLDAVRTFARSSEFAPLDEVPMVHAVSIYEARDEANQLVQDVPVEVANFKRPITLVLGAIESARWNVSLAEGACVDRVFLLGRKTSRVAGLPKDVTVVDFTGPNTQLDFHGSPSSDKPWEPRYLAAVHTLTGGDLVSVMCKSMHSTKDPPISVAPDNPDFRHHYALAELAQIDRELLLAPLRNMRFQAVHRTSSGTKTQSFLAEFTINGPVRDKWCPLAVPAHLLALDRRDGRHYVLADNKPYEIDFGTGLATPLGDPWDTKYFVAEGLACDAKRNRLLAWVRLAQRIDDSKNFWGNRLYAFDLTSRKWQEVARTSQHMGGLAHDAERDVLFTLNLPSPATAVTSMSMLNVQAASLDAVQFPHAMLWRPDQGIPQMLVLADRLIVIMPPQRVPAKPQPRIMSEIYVIDLSDGRMARACAFDAENAKRGAE